MGKQYSRFSELSNQNCRSKLAFSQNSLLSLSQQWQDHDCWERVPPVSPALELRSFSLLREHVFMKPSGPPDEPTRHRLVDSSSGGNSAPSATFNGSRASGGILSFSVMSSTTFGTDSRWCRTSSRSASARPIALRSSRRKSSHWAQAEPLLDSIAPKLEIGPRQHTGQTSQQTSRSGDILFLQAEIREDFMRCC